MAKNSFVAEVNFKNLSLNFYYLSENMRFYLSVHEFQLSFIYSYQRQIQGLCIFYSFQMLQCSNVAGLLDSPLIMHKKILSEMQFSFIQLTLDKMKLREIKLPYPELVSKSSTTNIIMNVKLPAPFLLQIPLLSKHLIICLGHQRSYIYNKKIDQT